MGGEDHLVRSVLDRDMVDMEQAQRLTGTDHNACARTTRMHNSGWMPSWAAVLRASRIRRFRGHTASSLRAAAPGGCVHPHRIDLSDNSSVSS
jgi:hypothetical protein